MSELQPDIEKILDTLKGSRESFRASITDKDRILACMCRYAERMAKKKRVPPWSIISDITDHGSGVSNAIYELYRSRNNDTK